MVRKSIDARARECVERIHRVQATGLRCANDLGRQYDRKAADFDAASVIAVSIQAAVDADRRRRARRG